MSSSLKKNGNHQQGSATAKSKDNQETVLIDLGTKQDCLKIVKEFNKETARYSSLVIGLGGSHDTETLREEMKKSRVKAIELAQQNKHRLLPRLRGYIRLTKHEIADYEKLWNIFSACLEVLYDQLNRTLILQCDFPLHLGTTIFIQTGMMEHLPCLKSSASMAVEQLDTPHSDKSSKEKEDCKVLERLLCDIKDMLVEMHEKVDCKPWEAEPIQATDNYDSKSLKSESDASSTVEVVSVFDQDRQRRRKRICLISIILLSAVVFATVLGMCIALLT